jgi:serine/threonine protein kinase
MSYASLLSSIPQTFGNYSLTRPIESGSTCVVSEAVDTTTGTYYAVKILPFSETIPTKLKQAIDREIRTLRRCSSQHICKLYDVLQQDKLIFLVLENCTGGNLLSMILEDRLQHMADVQRIFRQVVQGVKYLHDHGIAHGDIKPENVVFDSYGNAKLIDLGYCKETLIGSDLDKSGTFRYAAPEMLRSGVYNTYSADVWALGILLFVMVTGRFPYSSDNDRVIKHMIQTGQLTLLPRMDEKVVQLFKRMTMVDPDERLTVDEVLASPWLAPDKNPSARPQNSTLRLLLKGMFKQY